MKKYKKPEEEYKKGLTGRESLLISALARQDKKIFNIEDSRSVIGKEMDIKGPAEIFPPDLPAILSGYCGRELGRLIYPLPEMETVIHELRSHLKSLVKPAFAEGRST